jgi:hypothetical protein
MRPRRVVVSAGPSHPRRRGRMRGVPSRETVRRAETEDVAHHPFTHSAERPMIEGVHAGVLEPAFIAVPALPDGRRAILDHVPPGRESPVRDHLPGQLVVAELAQLGCARCALDAGRKMAAVAHDAFHRRPPRRRCSGTDRNQRQGVAGLGVTPIWPSGPRRPAETRHGWPRTASVLFASASRPSTLHPRHQIRRVRRWQISPGTEPPQSALPSAPSHR